MPNKYNKLKGMLRDMYNTNVQAPPPSPSKSPVLKYSIPIYEIYEDETDMEIIFKSKKQDDINNSLHDLSPYINKNKIIVEIIILSYLFSSTLILAIIKHIFN